MINTLKRKIEIEDTNDKLLVAFSFVLFLPIFFDFIAAYTGGNSSIFTLLIYAGTLSVFFIKFYRVIRPLWIIVLFTLYILFIFNYLLFPISEPYISSMGFILVCVYFLPISILLFTQIKWWPKLTYFVNLFTIPAIIIGLYILFCTDISSGNEEDALFTYMEFSYALLPFICASFAIYIETKKKLFLIIFFIGLLETISYGCRGAIISIALYVFVSIIFNAQTNKILVSLFFLIGIILFLFLDTIANSLLSLGIFSNSYFLHHFVEGEMFESSRSDIYQLCINRISTVGIEVSGLFGDRPFCGSVYPHNFVYEVIMQFGWLLGLLILFPLMLIVIKCIKNKNTRNPTAFILCAMLLKFLLSGSYLLSGQFWVATAALIAMSSRNKRTTT